MTANKDTNDAHKPQNDDADWQNFLEAHGEDLTDIERSRTARKFEKHAEKQEKKRLLDASDLTSDSFTAKPGVGRGPRDFRTSWLDMDDSLGDDGTFTPAPADLGSMKRSTIAFAIITLVGVLGLILVLFVPAIARILGTVAGLLTLIGAAGLVMQLRGHNETKTSPFDDGARV